MPPSTSRALHGIFSGKELLPVGAPTYQYARKYDRPSITYRVLVPIDVPVPSIISMTGPAPPADRHVHVHVLLLPVASRIG